MVRRVSFVHSHLHHGASLYHTTAISMLPYLRHMYPSLFSLALPLLTFRSGTHHVALGGNTSLARSESRTALLLRATNPNPAHSSRPHCALLGRPAWGIYDSPPASHRTLVCHQTCPVSVVESGNQCGVAFVMLLLPVWGLPWKPCSAP